MEQYLATGQVSFTFKQFAVMGPDSVKAAEASECASEQNRFWEYRDKLFDSQRSPGAFTVANLKKYATQLGLDAASFSTCLDSGRSAAKLQADLEEGKKYRIQGVPAVMINGKMAAEGLAPLAAYQQIIDAELSK